MSSIHQWQPDSYFMPLSNCIPVKGYLRSVICDLQRCTFRFIPNELCELMIQGKGKPVKDLVPLGLVADHDQLKEYMDFLQEYEYAIWLDETERNWFPPLNMEWDRPSHITNMSIDIGPEIPYDFAMLIAVLDQLNCQHLQLFSHHPHSTGFWISILEKTLHSRIKHIEIYAPYPVTGVDTAVMAEVYTTHLRLQSFVYYNAPRQEEIILTGHKRPLKFFTGHIAATVHTSQVHPFRLTCNILTFTESVMHHSYFNRKMHIAADGLIKNAAGSPDHFGYLQDTDLPGSLLTIAASTDFRKYWHITKSTCDVCKSCELRYMCTDQRIPRQRSTDEWFFDTECNYNPFIAQWLGDQQYRPLAECGITSHQDLYAIDEERITAINRHIWEDL